MRRRGAAIKKTQEGNTMHTGGENWQESSINELKSQIGILGVKSIGGVYAQAVIQMYGYKGKASNSSLLKFSIDFRRHVELLIREMSIPERRNIMPSFCYCGLAINIYLNNFSEDEIKSHSAKEAAAYFINIMRDIAKINNNY